MKSTRERILETLQTREAATAVELSQLLNLTAADMRYHLTALLAEGSIQRLDGGAPQKRGRPTTNYGLSQEYLKHDKHNLDTLTSAMLEEINNILGENDFKEFLGRLAERMGRKGNGSLRNPTRLLFQAIQRLNAMNYQARWEAHAQAPRVIFSHCPYLAILEKHPEMCQLDEAMLEKMLGSTVRQAAKRKPDRSGALQCIFLMEREGAD